MGLKILMTTMSLGIGGAETHIVELAKELRRRGNEVVVVSNGGVYVADILAAGITHYEAPLHRRKLRCMLRSACLLRRIIKKEKPDIVHAHARIPAFICGLLRKTMRFPFVTTAHWVFDVNGGLKYLTDWGEKTIAVSEDIKEYLITNYGVDEHGIYVTINGIDTDKFAADTSCENIDREFHLDRTKPVISYVSRLDQDRALVAEQLIDIAPELAQRITGIQLLITGGGDVYENLKAKADAVNTAVGRQLIIMTGARTDINELVAAGDIFIGVSRSALEAMASEKPVILAGNEGYIGLFSEENADAASEGNFCNRGFPMSTGDRLLGDIVRCFALTQDERTALGTYGRNFILSNYSVSRMTDDCVRAYEAARRRKYNVVMSGYYGVGNAGDEAILQSIHHNITNAGASATGTGRDVAITVLSSDPADTKARYGYHAVNRFRFFDVVRALRHCDALVSGGGSLLQDLTSTRSLVYYLMIIKLAMLLGKKVMIYANGIGPVRKKFNRFLVRRIVGRSDIITLRDAASARELESMGVKRSDIRVTADPAFTLGGLLHTDAAQLLDEAGVPTDQPFVCLSVRGWNNTGSFYVKLAAICDLIYDKYQRNIVFLPMQTPSDTVVSRDVMKLMKHPAYVLEKRYTAKETMGIIGLSDLVIAMRLHALIFAARMCVPLTGLVYDPKVAAYVETLGMLSAGNVQAFDSDIALSVITAVMDDREKYIDILKTRTVSLELLAREDARLLQELLEAPKRKKR